jgi:ribosomal protein L11 methylase PrmA
MNRDDDLKNLWEELNRPTFEAEEKEDKEETPKEAVELESLLSRLEDVVSRLEEALGKKEEADKDSKADKNEDSADDEEEKKESYVPRRVRRSMRNR